MKEWWGKCPKDVDRLSMYCFAASSQVEWRQIEQRRGSLGVLVEASDLSTPEELRMQLVGDFVRTQKLTMDTFGQRYISQLEKKLTLGGKRVEELITLVSQDLPSFRQASFFIKSSIGMTETEHARNRNSASHRDQTAGFQGVAAISLNRQAQENVATTL